VKYIATTLPTRRRRRWSLRRIRPRLLHPRRRRTSRPKSSTCWWWARSLFAETC